MKIAIIGSRDYLHLHRVAQLVQSLPKDTVVVSGGAKGVDRYAVEVATKCGLPDPVEIPVEKNEIALYGFPTAAKRRNKEIVRQSSKVYAFWRENTSGTANAVCHAVALGIPVEVILDD